MDSRLHIPGLAKSTTMLGLVTWGLREPTVREGGERRTEDSEVRGRVHMERQPGVDGFFCRALL